MLGLVDLRLRSFAWIGTTLLAGCLTVPKEVPRAKFAWQVEPDGIACTLQVWRDGSLDLSTQDRRGDAPEPLATRHLAASVERAAAARDVDVLVLTLPRWSHASAVASGVRVQFSIDATLCHESFDCCPAALQAWLQRVCATEPELAALAEPALAPMRKPTFVYGPGSDPRTLVPCLLREQPDIALRHLAARIVIEERPVQIRAELSDAYRQSCAGGSRGDYYLASALLALGVLDGVPRVVEIAQASHPQWATEARLDLANWFRVRELGCPDPALAPEAFLDWVQQRQARLTLDTRRRTYRLQS
jgi:hypothetical protein